MAVTNSDLLPPGVGRIPAWWMECTPHYTLDVDDEEARQIAEDQMTFYYMQLAAADDAGIIGPDGKPKIGPDGKPMKWEGMSLSAATKHGTKGAGAGGVGGFSGRTFKPGQAVIDPSLFGIKESDPNYHAYLTGAKLPPGYFEVMADLVSASNQNSAGNPYSILNNNKQTDYGRYGRQAERQVFKPSWAKKQLRKTSQGQAVRKGIYNDSPNKFLDMNNNNRRIQPLDSPHESMDSAPSTPTPPTPTLPKTTRSVSPPPREQYFAPPSLSPTPPSTKIPTRPPPSQDNSLSPTHPSTKIPIRPSPSQDIFTAPPRQSYSIPSKDPSTSSLGSADPTSNTEQISAAVSGLSSDDEKEQRCIVRQVRRIRMTQESATTNVSTVDNSETTAEELRLLELQAQKNRLLEQKRLAEAEAVREAEAHRQAEIARKAEVARREEVARQAALQKAQLEHVQINQTERERRKNDLENKLVQERQKYLERQKQKETQEQPLFHANRNSVAVDQDLQAKLRRLEELKELKRQQDLAEAARQQQAIEDEYDEETLLEDEEVTVEDEEEYEEVEEYTVTENESLVGGSVESGVYENPKTSSITDLQAILAAKQAELARLQAAAAQSK